MTRTPILLLVAALVAAGCGSGSGSKASGDDRAAVSPDEFTQCFGITIYGSADDILTRGVENVVFNYVYDEDMGAGEREFAITTDAVAANSADDGDAADEIARLVWDEGYGGGAGRGAGGTDQTALVLISEAEARDEVRDLVEQMYRPVFNEDVRDDEIGWDEFRSDHIFLVGDNMVVVDTNPDGFTKRVRRAFDECAGA